MQNMTRYYRAGTAAVRGIFPRLNRRRIGKGGFDACAACQPQCGLSGKARAKAAMFALPSVTMASACFAVVIMPTVRTTMPVAAQPLKHRRVVTRAARRPDLSPRTARRDVDVIEPDVLERFAERSRIYTPFTTAQPPRNFISN